MKEQQTISQLSSEFSLHPTQISDCRAADCGGVRWKKQLLEKGKTVFQSNQSNGKHKLQVIQESELYEQIGRLKMELEWIKKKSASFS
jgi:transposase